MSMVVSLATTSLRIMLSEVLCNNGCSSPAASLLIRVLLPFGLLQFSLSRKLKKPGHACPAAAAGGHVRPAPCVPGNARRPWRRWMAGALGDIFRCASILQITTESVSHSMLCQLSNQYFFGDLSRSCCYMIRVVD